ncbi:ligand-binding sensor domain-containing protein [Alteromonas gracilis]|uniref:ligand-binding sensor domain-containing protein n=1 Tax=Alteromonas gracilis TaxID=1479524 RepID=UPI0030CCBF4B
MSRFTLLIFLLFFAFLTAEASPRLSNPVFQSLSTKNGLPQDVVNDIVVDEEGFVWIATEGGAVRWDGVNTRRITGPNNTLVDSSIYKLTLQENKALWFSVYGQGVFYLDLSTQEVIQIEPKPYHELEDFIQHAEFFHWQDESNLIIALGEEVQRFNTQTNTLETIATLSKTEIENFHSIRAAITVNNYLLVATTTGLFANDLNDKDLSLTPVEYLNGIETNLDNANAKFLMLDNSDRVWLSTVENVFVADKSKLLAQLRGASSGAFERVVDQTNVWTMEEAKDDSFWLGTNRGLFSLTKTAAGWEHEHILEPHNGTTAISDKKITAIAKDETGNIWLSSIYAGALYFGVKSADIFTIQNERFGKEQSLTSHVTWAFAETEPNKLWIGTSNGLNHYDFST